MDPVELLPLLCSQYCLWPILWSVLPSVVFTWLVQHFLSLFLPFISIPWKCIKSNKNRSWVNNWSKQLKYYLYFTNKADLDSGIIRILNHLLLSNIWSSRVILLLQACIGHESGYTCCLMLWTDVRETQTHTVHDVLNPGTDKMTFWGCYKAELNVCHWGKF